MGTNIHVLPEPYILKEPLHSVETLELELYKIRLIVPWTYKQVPLLQL